jgi:hypothetical protein
LEGLGIENISVAYGHEMFYRNLVYLMAIWYFYPVLVCFTIKIWHYCTQFVSLRRPLKIGNTFRAICLGGRTDKCCHRQCFHKPSTKKWRWDSFGLGDRSPFFKKKLALNIQMLDAGEKFTLRGELLP